MLQSPTLTERSWYLVILSEFSHTSQGLVVFLLGRTDQLHDMWDLSPYMRWLENMKLWETRIFPLAGLLTLFPPLQEILQVLPASLIVCKIPSQEGRYARRLAFPTLLLDAHARASPHTQYFEPHGVLMFDTPHSPVVLLCISCTGPHYSVPPVPGVHTYPPVSCIE
ncbi:hypothetical protein EDD15DRAFT_2196036 [Pisolithus albus]|nr:hypothetical protein EDD15DRAFT_2196036 [Pisolithus albus]